MGADNVILTLKSDESNDGLYPFRKLHNFKRKARTGVAVSDATEIAGSAAAGFDFTSNRGLY